MKKGKGGSTTTIKEYEVHNGYVYKMPKTEDELRQKICKEMAIKRILTNIDTEDISLELEYVYTGTRRTLMLPRSEVSRKGLTRLRDKGLDVIDDAAEQRKILHYLHWSEENATQENIHSNLGWGTVAGQKIFKLDKAIGGDSEYSGTLQIKPSGKYRIWKEMVEEHVIGCIPMEFALICGFAAPVASLLTQEISMDVIMVHLYGDSSQGKSTATRLAISSFGEPNIAKNGLVKSWSGTDNAVMAQFRNIHGVPMALDEASVKNGDFTGFIYTIASGKEKMRLDSDSQYKDSPSWSGVFLSNAELSIKGKSKKNTGISARILEMDNVKWTRSAEHADAINKVVGKNYGHAGIEFVKGLMKQDVNELLKRFQSLQKEAKEKLADNMLASRMADKVAVFNLTAELVKEFLGLMVDIEAITQMLIKKIGKDNESVDLPRKSYQYFLEVMEQYKGKFTKDLNETKDEVWGRIDDIKKETMILPKKFNEIMSGGEFEDTTVILDGWKKQKWISCDKDKYTRKRSVQKDGQKLRVYVIKQVSL